LIYAVAPDHGLIHMPMLDIMYASSTHGLEMTLGYWSPKIMFGVSWPLLRALTYLEVERDGGKRRVTKRYWMLWQLLTHACVLSLYISQDGGRLRIQWAGYVHTMAIQD